MNRHDIMRLRQKALWALDDPSIAVRTWAEIVLRLWPVPEFEHERKARNA